MKKYWSLIGITALVLIIGWLWHQALFAYLAEHTYYFWMLSSWQNRWVIISALLCAWVFPLLYLIWCSKVKIRNLIIRFIVGAWVFGLIHSNIKWNPIWFWNVITVFNTILLVSLWIYLILWFSALWSLIERKLVKFNQIRRQEIFLSFWIWFCSSNLTLNLTVILNYKLDSFLMIVIFDSIWKGTALKMVRDNFRYIRKI